MSDRRKKQHGTLRRRAVSLLTALTFLVLSVTGVIAFILPFDIGIIGLHALMGFVFVGLIGLHVFNNSRPLASYLHSKTLWVTLATTAALTALFWWQPAPVKVVLGWSGNLGPAMQRFEMTDDGMVFDYAPSPEYQMRLDVRTGPAFHSDSPPQLAIWLQNQGGYHIKTLLAPEDGGETPYWQFKHAGWEEAKRKAAELEDVDATTMPTPNSSFDPADYIQPQASEDARTYQLLLEVNQPGDEQASLVYLVEVNNALPRAFQLLALRGYPKRGADDEDGKAVWDVYFIDESFTTALDLIDSALLTIDRGS